jgi:hypothetical protein
LSKGGAGETPFLSGYPLTARYPLSRQDSYQYPIYTDVTPILGLLRAPLGGRGEADGAVTGIVRGRSGTDNRAAGWPAGP